MVTVRFKLKNGAKAPIKGSEGAAGYDLFANSITIDSEGRLVIDSQTMVEIPRGHVGWLFPRSSVSNTGLAADFSDTKNYSPEYLAPIYNNAVLLNKIGNIDSDFRGTITGKFKIIDPTKKAYEVGDRFAQLLIVPLAMNITTEFLEVEELSDTARGAGGYGSTGN